MTGAVPPLSLYAFMTWRDNITFLTVLPATAISFLKKKKIVSMHAVKVKVK
jgi:hypothetical protein